MRKIKGTIRTDFILSAEIIVITLRTVAAASLGKQLAEPRTLPPLQAAAITYRIAFGPRTRLKLLTLRGAQPREAIPRHLLCADLAAVSLDAVARMEAHDRKRREQLSRYISRPVPSGERVQCNAAKRVELELKTPWRDGATHMVIVAAEVHAATGGAAADTSWPASESRASDWFLPANSKLRMSLKGRELAVTHFESSR